MKAVFAAILSLLFISAAHCQEVGDTTKYIVSHEGFVKVLNPAVVRGKSATVEFGKQCFVAPHSGSVSVIAIVKEADNPLTGVGLIAEYIADREMVENSSTRNRWGGEIWAKDVCPNGTWFALTASEFKRMQQATAEAIVKSDIDKWPLSDIVALKHRQKR